MLSASVLSAELASLHARGAVGAPAQQWAHVAQLRTA
jgi:hypothetical protein